MVRHLVLLITSAPVGSTILFFPLRDNLERVGVVSGYAGDLLAPAPPQAGLPGTKILSGSRLGKRSVGRGLDPSSFYIPSIQLLIAHF